MKPIRVQFVNFWKGYDKSCYVFTALLQRHINHQVVTSDPDIIFFADSPFYGRRTKVEDLNIGNSVVVSYTGENYPPSSEVFDFSFSYENTTDTNYLLPDFAMARYYYDFPKQSALNKFQRKDKTEFCNFIYRNKKALERIQFCNQLQQYKRVDCPGACLNNMPNFTGRGRKAVDWWGDKINHIGKYKFTIAFENESAPNYVTEKMFDALYVGSIPIYWGAPNITEFFDPNSFVNVQDFSSFDKVIEFIKEIDTNTELYNKMRSTPPIHDGSRLKVCTEETILERFDKIVNMVKER